MEFETYILIICEITIYLIIYIIFFYRSLSFDLLRQILESKFDNRRLHNIITKVMVASHSKRIVTCEVPISRMLATQFHMSNMQRQN